MAHELGGMAVARVLPRRRCSVLTELNARNDPEEALEHLSALAVCLIGAAFRRMMATRLQSPMRDAFQWKVFSGRSSMEILSRQKSTLMIHRSAGPPKTCVKVEGFPNGHHIKGIIGVFLKENLFYHHSSFRK